MSKKKKKVVKSECKPAGGDAAAPFLQPYAFIFKYPIFLGVLSLAVLLPAVYSSTFSSSTFLLHEDSVLRLPLLSHAGNIPDIFSQDFLLFTAGQYRPLSYALLALVRGVVAADQIFFWHCWLLGFHAGNALLVFWLVRRFADRPAAALFAALAFALHPLCTTLVNDIDQFYMIFGLFLCLASMNVYLLFSHGRGIGWYWTAVGTYALALFTARIAYAVVLFLLVYELVYRRSGWKRTVMRLLPFALLPIVFAPYLFMASPHPLHFKYVQMHKKSFWHGWFSITGASGLFADGLLLARKIPAVLHETVKQVYSWTNGTFLFWLLIDVILLGVGFWSVWRKRWFGFGILLLFFGMIPYATVAINRVVDYVSWIYLYFSVVGIAMLVGAIIETSLRASSRYWKIGISALVMMILMFWGIRTMQLNRLTRSPLTFWNYVYDLNNNSQTALNEVGKAYLEQNALPIGAHFLFAPMIKDVKESCLTMARYYRKKGEYLASAIHLRYGSGKESTGVVLEKQSLIAADLLIDAGAPDHAEENLGKVLMVNPFNTAAMCGLAHVWFLKGFVSEAERMIERVRTIAPTDENADRVEMIFRKMKRGWEEEEKELTVKPPSPDWLKYVLDQERSTALRRDIIDLSYRADPNDVIIQLEAMISLIENEDYKEAANKVEVVARCLNGNSYACAVACEALARVGEIEKAVQIGVHAIVLDNSNMLAWRSMAIAYAQYDVEKIGDRNFIDAIARNPSMASMFYYNLGLQKSKQGDDQKAAEYFRKSVEAQPDHVDARQALGMSLLNLGQMESAEESLKSSLQYKKDNAETYVHLGRALMAQHKQEEGLEAFRTALQIDPKKAVTHYYVGSVLEIQKKEEEAIRALLRAIELEPKFVAAHFKLGNCYYKIKDYAQAMEEYNRVIRLDPAFKNVHLNLGTIHFLQDDVEEAIACYQEEIRVNPTFKEPYRRLIDIYCSRKDAAQARTYADLAAKNGIVIDQKELDALKAIENPQQ